MQRVKDVERFLADLERPVPGIEGAGARVTEADLEQDAASFVAFAQAFGVRPPRNGATPSELNVTSASST